MDLGKNCPGCKKPLNGRECNYCGTTPSEESIVTCEKCRDRVVERKTESHRRQEIGRTGQYYVCWECQ